MPAWWIAIRGGSAGLLVSKQQRRCARTCHPLAACGLVDHARGPPGGAGRRRLVSSLAPSPFSTPPESESGVHELLPCSPYPCSFPLSARTRGRTAASAAPYEILRHLLTSSVFFSSLPHTPKLGDDLLSQTITDATEHRPQTIAPHSLRRIRRHTI